MNPDHSGPAAHRPGVLQTAYSDDGGSYVPPANKADWTRYPARRILSEGMEHEAFHPNAFGRQAMGNYLVRFTAEIDRAAKTISAKCSGGPGVAPGEMAITSKN